ncbi:MAG: hypothetical protein JSR72_23435 [Proteobacteria bacterium]|nr:hypothetical protein [Pseudomonadota bacterium]
MNAPTPRIARSSAWLMVSAAVLLVLIMVQLGRTGWRGVSRSDPSAAFAGMMNTDVVSRVGDYSMLTFETGTEDVLVVLDGHGEDLYAYRIRNQKNLEFLQRARVPDIFQSCKALEANR